MGTQAVPDRVPRRETAMGTSMRRAWYVLRRNPLSLLGAGFIVLLIVVAIVGPSFTVYDPIRPNLAAASQPPSAQHWMGTDRLGMDIFTRIVYATRIDLLLGIAGVLGALVLGAAFGMVSAYYGGWLDEVMMRLLDSLQAFPTIILGMTIAAVLGPSIRNVAVVLVVVNFPIYARLMRSLVLSAKEAQYVDAARSVGNGDARIMFGHILGNCMGPIYIQASLNMGWSVLMAASLSFIGLGAQAPQPEWGLMIRDGARYMTQGMWWMSFFPGLMIFLFVLAVNLVGDGLQEILDPRRR